MTTTLAEERPAQIGALCRFVFTHASVIVTNERSDVPFWRYGAFFLQGNVQTRTQCLANFFEHKSMPLLLDASEEARGISFVRVTNLVFVEPYDKCNTVRIVAQHMGVGRKIPLNIYFLHAPV
jgi:hypothetical protein